MCPSKLVTRDEAMVAALDYLHAQPWGDEFDEKPSRIVESNECINILFRYKEPHQPPEIIVSIEKNGGKAEAIKLG